MNGLIRPIDSAKGILRLPEGLAHFDLVRRAPAVELSAWIEAYWAVEWSLGDQKYSQENIPHPSVNLSFENFGLGFSACLTGIWPRNYVRELTGTGKVFGVKFRPAMFRAWWHSAIGDLTGKALALTALAGKDLTNFCRDLQSMEQTQVFTELDRLLITLIPPSDPQGQVIRDLIDLMQTDRSIRSSNDVAQRLGVDVRTAQRLFLAWVGVGPKWIIMRYRIHEAIDRLAGAGADPAIDLGALALDLGYWDQAHFSHEFQRMTGNSPDAYRRRNRLSV